MEKCIRRGDIYYADLDPAIGSEQGGKRPVLVLQNDIGNKFSNTVIVAALTSKMKPKLPTHLVLPEVAGLIAGSIILLEQLRTVDKSRLDKQAGKLDPAMMRLVDVGLITSLGLKMDSSSVMFMSLCRTCVKSFQDSEDYKVYRVDYDQSVKETCTVCHVRAGFDYEVVRR